MHMDAVSIEWAMGFMWSKDSECMKAHPEFRCKYTCMHRIGYAVWKYMQGANGVFSSKVIHDSRNFDGRTKCTRTTCILYATIHTKEIWFSFFERGLHCSKGQEVVCHAQCSCRNTYTTVIILLEIPFCFRSLDFWLLPLYLSMITHDARSSLL